MMSEPLTENKIDLPFICANASGPKSTASRAAST
jgi:hypothetical protein